MKTLTLTEADVTFTLDCLPEDDGPEGHFASGNDEQDARDCANIRRELEDGNPWAWCCVRLTGKYKSLSATDSLGGCNYDSEEQFKQPDGYYDDMKARVLADLNAQLVDLCACA